jgi:hypothetical protein
MTAVTTHTAAKMLGVNPIYELRKNGSARMHARILARKNLKKMRHQNCSHVQIAHMPSSTHATQNKGIATDTQLNSRMILV